MNATLQRPVRAAMQLRRLATNPTSSKLTGASLTGQKIFGPVDPKIKKMQALFLDPNNTDPIYIKRGTSDKILLGITCLLVALGSVNVFQTVIQKKWY